VGVRDDLSIPSPCSLVSRMHAADFPPIWLFRTASSSPAKSSMRSEITCDVTAVLMQLVLRRSAMATDVWILRDMAQIAAPAASASDPARTIQLTHDAPYRSLIGWSRLRPSISFRCLPRPVTAARQYCVNGVAGLICLMPCFAPLLGCACLSLPKGLSNVIVPSANVRHRDVSLGAHIWGEQRTQGLQKAWKPTYGAT
jgi:hypothetical protein